MGLIRNLKPGFVYEFVLYFAQYGIVEMMLSLTRLENLNFCRSFTELHIGSTCGLTSSPRTSGDIWILDALVWWRSFRLSSARVAGSVLIRYKMHRLILYSLFRWLIHIATLRDHSYREWDRCRVLRSGNDRPGTGARNASGSTSFGSGSRSCSVATDPKISASRYGNSFKNIDQK